MGVKDDGPDKNTRPDKNSREVTTEVTILGAPSRKQSDHVRLIGQVTLPPFARGIVVVAHVGASDRRRVGTGWNLGAETQLIENIRRRAEVGTLIVDLLASEEDDVHERDESADDARLEVADGVDLSLLAERLSAATNWVLADETARHLPIGYLASGVGAAATVMTASSRSDVRAIVSRAGRPDLAGPALEELRVPTLFVVAEKDDEVFAGNRSARGRVRGLSELAVIGGVDSSFGTTAARDELAQRSAEWFVHHLG